MLLAICYTLIEAFLLFGSLWLLLQDQFSLPPLQSLVLIDIVVNLSIAGGLLIRQIFFPQITLYLALDEIAPLFYQLLFLQNGLLTNRWIVGLLDFLNKHLLNPIL